MSKSRKKNKIDANKDFLHREKDKYPPQQEDVGESEEYLLSDEKLVQSLSESSIHATNIFEEPAIQAEGKSADELLQNLLDPRVQVLQVGGLNQSADIKEVFIDQQNPSQKSDKRVEPQNLNELIAAFLTGKVKSISEPLARRLRISSPLIEVDARGELLRLAQVSDVTLDKVRKLLISTKILKSNSILEKEVVEFCIDCILSNKFVRAEDMRALLFPGHDDNSSIEDAWARLQSLTILNSIDAEECKPESPHLDRADSFEVAKPVAEPEKHKNEKPDRALATMVVRTHRNALGCSAIWRVRQKQMQFSEVFRSLRATLFALERRIITADDELLEALSSISEKESGVVALVLDWSLKQQIESRNQFDALDRRHSITTRELTEAREQLMQVTTHAERLSKQLGEERAAGEQLHKEIGVAKTHGQADLEDLRSLALKTLRDALSQLAVVSEALKRDPPKIQSALDKVEAVMDRLKSANDNLEET